MWFWEIEYFVMDMQVMFDKKNDAKWHLYASDCALKIIKSPIFVVQYAGNRIRHLKTFPHSFIFFPSIYLTLKRILNSQSNPSFPAPCRSCPPLHTPAKRKKIIPRNVFKGSFGASPTVWKIVSSPRINWKPLPIHLRALAALKKPNLSTKRKWTTFPYVLQSFLH